MIVTALIRIHGNYVKLKYEILGKRLSNPKRNDRLQCNIQATEAERELIINPKDQMAHESLSKAKQKMERIQLDKARGAQTRARINWIEEGERNTKYFAA